MGTWLAWKYNAAVMKRYEELCGEVVTRKIGDPPIPDGSQTDADAIPGGKPGEC
jgi:hypothetical protein